MAGASSTAVRLRDWAWQERWLLAIALLALALGIALGYRYAQYRLYAGGAPTPRQAALLAQRAEQAETQSQALHRQLDHVRAELALAQGARAALAGELQSVQDELGRLRDQLAFFDQLLPAGPKGSLEIRGAAFEHHGAALRYRVLLLRNPAQAGKAFQGRLQFVASGMRNGRRVTQELLPLQVRPDGSAAPSAEAARELFALRFDQYQRSVGVLAVPASFIPQSISVRVLEGKIVRAVRSVDVDF